MGFYITGLEAVVVIDDEAAYSYILTILVKLLYTIVSKDMSDKPSIILLTLAV